MFIVYVEVAEGKPVSVDLELVNGLKAVTDKVTALVIGKDAEAAAKEAVAWGADSAIVVDGEQFEKYNSDAYAEAIAQVAKENAPEAVILGATQWGKELVPRVAAKLATGCANDVVGLKRDGDQLIFTVPAYSGNVLTDMTIEGNPVVASVRGGTFSKADAADEGKAADIAKKDITVDASLIRAQVKEAVEEITESVNLEDADVIIAGGRGMGSAEAFEDLQKLADIMGGVVGCSRPAMEAGWISRAHQVGQSGKIVAPKLYIAFGISGSTQHVTGMVGSKYIVAVNKDEDAPIFDIADVGIVGNVKDVLPIFIEEMSKRFA
ncbi:MAG: electron transfer flavoprotein subunit alpha/FixB family protein [Lachnospiraceae bacterium]|jgi:electron transfer flavoprotein alpha subunit